MTNPNGRVQVRRSFHRGIAGHIIVGIDILGRRVSIFTPYGEIDARRIAAAARLGDDTEVSRLLLLGGQND
jgi:hypothetical protein